MIFEMAFEQHDEANGAGSSSASTDDGGGAFKALMERDRLRYFAIPCFSAIQRHLGSMIGQCLSCFVLP